MSVTQPATQPTPLQARLVKNYATLVMAGKPIEEVPEVLRDWVNQEIARREIEILG